MTALGQDVTRVPAWQAGKTLTVLPLVMIFLILRELSVDPIKTGIGDLNASGGSSFVCEVLGIGQLARSHIS